MSIFGRIPKNPLKTGRDRAKLYMIIRERVSYFCAIYIRRMRRKRTCPFITSLPFRAGGIVNNHTDPPGAPHLPPADGTRLFTGREERRMPPTGGE